MTELVSRIWRRRVSLALTLATAFLMAACTEASRPPDFYTLSSLRDSGGGEARQGAGPAIGVGPVSFPKYLDRPQIVTRSSPNRLSLAEFHRWAEPLSDIFARTLADNLGVLMGTDQIFVLPRRRTMNMDFQIEIDVTKFDSDTVGKTELIARWTLYGTGGREALLSGESRISNDAADPADFESVVSAMSSAIEALSRELAETMRAAMT